MSSTPQSIPLTRRIRSGRATLIAVGVLLAIALAVTLVAVSNTTTVQTTHLRTSQANVASTPHTRYLGLRQVGRTVVKVPSPAAAVGNAASSPQTRYLGPRQAGAVVNGGPLPAAAVGDTASSPTVQPNPDQQAITSHSLPRGVGLPGWLLR